ncbi:MAG: hypothetical protein V1866_03275 [archaeon]
MCLKIKLDKNVWMNFLHSFIGGIFGGIVVAIALGQALPKQNVAFYLFFLLDIILIALIGILIMGHINYRWEESKGRISKKVK